MFYFDGVIMSIEEMMNGGVGVNGINIAKVIISKRKEKGITQDELANFIGVSKSSVSKWETGQCYPDIVYLPQLATYFNVSLDDLMSYEPQMTNEDISELYKELANELAVKPYDEVFNRCREIVKKYFSCYPLLCRIGLLYTNYGITSKDDKQKVSILAEAKELFIRVKEESDDIQLKQLALHAEATCEMMLGNPAETINLLDDIKPPPHHKVILSQAYLMKGEVIKAKTELQESMFFNIMEFFEIIPAYLVLCAGDIEQFEETCSRAIELIKTWNLKNLTPITILSFYIIAAQGYIANKNTEKALELLETYTDIITGDIYPLNIVKQDKFFNLIDGTTGKLTFGITEAPRDEKSIKQSMTDAVVENPAFSVLSEDLNFKRLAEKLNNNLL